MSLEKAFKNRLETELEVTDAGLKIDEKAQREEQDAAKVLSRVTQLFEESGLHDAAQSARDRAEIERQSRGERVERSVAYLERLVNLLKNPERMKRIAAITQRALQKDE